MLSSIYRVSGTLMRIFDWSCFFRRSLCPIEAGSIALWNGFLLTSFCFEHIHSEQTVFLHNTVAVVCFWLLQDKYSCSCCMVTHSARQSQSRHWRKYHPVNLMESCPDNPSQHFKEISLKPRMKSFQCKQNGMFAEHADVDRKFTGELLKMLAVCNASKVQGSSQMSSTVFIDPQIYICHHGWNTCTIAERTPLGLGQ